MFRRIVSNYPKYTVHSNQYKDPMKRTLTNTEAIIKPGGKFIASDKKTECTSVIWWPDAWSFRRP